MPLPQPRIHRIAVSSLFFLAGICFASWASRIPAIQSSLALSNAALGAVLFSLPVGLLTSLPVAGFLVARYGSRIVVMLAAVLYAGTLPVLGFVHSTTQLMATLFIFGFGGNLLNISMNTQAVGVESFYNKPIMASFHGIWSTAGFSGAAIGTGMVRFGILPGYHFLCISGLALLILVVFSHSLVVQDTGQDEKRPIFAKPDKAILTLGLIAFCSMICEGAMFDWSGIYFEHVVQPGKAWVTVGYTAFMSTMATGRFVGDWVAFKLGMKRMLQLSGSCTASGLLLAVCFPHFITATLGFLLVGAGVSSVVPMIYSAAGKSEKMSPGVALAAVSTIGYLGFLFGPPFIGFIAQASSLRVSLGLIALMGAMIVFLAGRMQKT
ncbi:MAG: MFS transporter [Bacteroidota bacterium]|nr:MFS transporter [Bacteroidota bacterium]MDP4211524.1 MFS transporter [Bacteroidota bacterium]MDP4249739.1 MFS transporter [Bacteroidota bacterium]